MEDKKPDGPGHEARPPAAGPPEATPPAIATPETEPPVALSPDTTPQAVIAPDAAPPAGLTPDPIAPAATTREPKPPAVVTPERPAAASPPRDRAPAPRVERPLRGPRPDILELREPLYREAGGYRLRLDPPDLARLRELPGSREKTDRELGEQFFDANCERLTGAVADDVPAPAELRVVVDPFSRQAFLALGQTIRGIVSF